MTKDRVGHAAGDWPTVETGLPLYQSRTAIQEGAVLMSFAFLLMRSSPYF